MYSKHPSKRIRKGKKMKQIKVYGTLTGCPQCNATKKFLDTKNVDYEFIDITNDDNLREELRGEGYQSMPVVKTHKEVWTGFQPTKLKAYIELK